jgi:hypothetical protein
MLEYDIRHSCTKRLRKQRARVPSLPDGWHFNGGVDLEDVWVASGFELGTGGKHISEATFWPGLSHTAMYEYTSWSFNGGHMEPSGKD